MQLFTQPGNAEWSFITSNLFLKLILCGTL